MSLAGKAGETRGDLMSSLDEWVLMWEGDLGYLTHAGTPERPCNHSHEVGSLLGLDSLIELVQGHLVANDEPPLSLTYRHEGPEWRPTTPSE